MSGKMFDQYVLWVQECLNKILSLRLKEDGLIGSDTRSAIRSFQRRQRLPARPDGVVCPNTEQALIKTGAVPPPGMAKARDPETTPPARTVYMDIPLQIPLGKAKSMTGIFVPENYCPVSQVDLIVYLHGFKVRSHKPERSIDTYWSLPRFLLREEVNKSQRNVILVAPTLGPQSQAGSLTCPGGFDKFLGQVMTALMQNAPYAGTQVTPSIGNIILACHSGSWSVMQDLAMGTDASAAHIQECWAFDPESMSSRVWKEWAKKNPAPKLLYIYYRDGRAGQMLCQELMRVKSLRSAKVNCLPNVSAEKSTAEHDDIPSTHMKDRIQGAQFLLDKSKCRSSGTRLKASAIRTLSGFREVPLNLPVTFAKPGELWNGYRAEELWQGEISRNSPDYIKWLQRSLNQIMGLRLAVDGISGTQTRSAIRSFQQQHGLMVDGVVGPQTAAAIKAALAGGYAPPQPQPRPWPPSSGTYTPGAPLRQNIVRLAQGEFARWNQGQTPESDPSMRAVLEGYWRATPVGVPTTPTWWSNIPWSAAFVSWVMKNAGAGSNFQYSNAHTDYVGAAKRNRLANNSNPFKAYRLTEIAPRPGDLVCVERQDDQGNWSGVNYDNVDQGFRASHCDIVVEVQPGKLITIGGNVSNSVSDTPVQIDSTGYVIQSRYYAVVRAGV
jgi:peptidoglycan hydrolase-like protein with peptidoglycan-binding domain